LLPVLADNTEFLVTALLSEDAPDDSDSYNFISNI
jgi:hypothetical protein